MTASTMDAIAHTLGSYWKFKPSDDELQALVDETGNWNTLRPLAEAVDYATRNFDDRPTVAWLLRDARRRRDLANQPPPTRAGCPVCRGERWIDQRPDPADPPSLVSCPRCAPTTHELQRAGAYALDAPSTRENPAVSDILARHDHEHSR